MALGHEENRYALLDDDAQDVEREKTIDGAPGKSSVSETDSTKQSLQKVYRKISLQNGEINRLNKEQLKDKLRELHLNCTGHKDVLKKRLKTYYKNKKLQETCPRNASGCSDKDFDFLLVIDFEATCEEDNPPDYQHEIIEFPASLINVHAKEIVDEFHEFCRPEICPQLSSFCQGLTGISQATVDGARPFRDVLESMNDWLTEHGLGAGSTRFAVVSDGPWDMSRFMRGQCKLSGIKLPAWSKRWINIRKTFSNFYKVTRVKLSTMLEVLDMRFEGTPHCGRDDTRNIARIVVQLLKDGAELKINEHMYQGDVVRACRYRGRKNVQGADQEHSNEQKTKDDSSNENTDEQNVTSHIDKLAITS